MSTGTTVKMLGLFIVNGPEDWTLEGKRGCVLCSAGGKAGLSFFQKLLFALHPF